MSTQQDAKPTQSDVDEDLPALGAIARACCRALSKHSFLYSPAVQRIRQLMLIDQSKLRRVITRAHDPQTTVAGVRLWGKDRIALLASNRSTVRSIAHSQ